MKLNRQDYLYVLFQLLLFGAYLFEIKLLEVAVPAALHTLGAVTSVLGVAVMILALLQLNRHLSPFPTPKSDAALIRTGLYRYIRHPIYTGILLTAFGYAVHQGSVYKLLVAIALLILFHFKSNYEEKRLMEVYSEYEAYRRSTRRFP